MAQLIQLIAVVAGILSGWVVWDIARNIGGPWNANPWRTLRVFALAALCFWTWTLSDPNIQARRYRRCLWDAKEYFVEHPDFHGSIACEAPFLW